MFVDCVKKCKKLQKIAKDGTICGQNNDNLPEEAKAVMENRVFDCEICQQACPWNKKHIESPLVTKMATFFQSKISAWEEFFYPPNLAKITKKEYRETIGPLNTSIPHTIFHRNVLFAMKRVKKA